MYPDVPKNPVRALREARGVSPDDFAAMADASRSALCSLEAGRYTTIPERWACAIMTLGESYPAMCEAYKAWRTTRRLAVFDAYHERATAALAN